MENKMTILTIILISGLVIGGVGLMWQIAPSKSKLLVKSDETSFPVVSGYNLNRQELEFPQDFEKDLNLIIIAFQQYQQRIVNTWLPFAQEIEAAFPEFIYYELPTINEMPSFSRTFINEGMRAGIPDQTARERTITLYINKDAFKSTLNIPDENNIYIFLVEREGNILWRAAGEFSEDKAGELIQVIKERSDSDIH
jgi:hypothetical protein